MKTQVIHEAPKPRPTPKVEKIVIEFTPAELLYVIRRVYEGPTPAFAPSPFAGRDGTRCQGLAERYDPQLEQQIQAAWDTSGYERPTPGEALLHAAMNAGLIE